MTEPKNSSEPRVAPFHYDANGRQQFTWILTDSSLTDLVQLHVGPELVLPVIFVPGIMGSNLKTVDEGKPIWRLDAGIGGAPTDLAMQWGFRGAGKRQRYLHPARVAVDAKGAVPKGSKEKIYRDRKWGEVSETSYHGFLKWLDSTLNDEIFPEMWKDFRCDASGYEGKAPAVHYRRGVEMRMPKLDPALKLAPVTSDELMARSRFHMPVHAFGYNWLKSNDAAAKLLQDYINELIGTTYKDICQQVILVTHSMGGLVARRCAQLAGMSDRIAGVVHGVMPAVGAAVAYRRCKLGMKEESRLAGAVIGANGREVTAVFAQAPGALQLLPTRDYRPQWLSVVDTNGSAVNVQPASDPYKDIYLRRDRWWGLVREEWLAPKDGLSIDWTAYAKNIDKSRDFHDQIRGKYHPDTYVYYGADAAQPSFERVTWNMRPGMAPDGRPRPGAVETSRLGFSQVRDQGENPVYVGGHSVHLQGSSFAPGNDIQSSYWEMHCAMQDGVGDGTVPASSGAAPLRTDRNGHVKVQARLPGFDHEKSYLDARAQQFTLYALVKIASNAKGAK